MQTDVNFEDPKQKRERKRPERGQRQLTEAASSVLMKQLYVGTSHVTLSHDGPGDVLRTLRKN